MQIKFLIIEEEETVYLLGFELKLTKTEYKLLCSIANGEKASPEELLGLLRENAKLENIYAHINAINKKAKAISGRKLIVFGQHKYSINPYM